MPAPAPERRGRLHLVGTPIGSLDELTPRAIGVLGAVPVVVCEDTRKLAWLLRAVGVASPGRVIVANEHVEEEAARQVVAALEAGDDVAFVSDAGMPGVADPGARTVRAALDNGFEVTVVNGPSAVLAALVVSGLPTGRFVVEGFLPRRGHGRRERLAEVAVERRTTVLFEAPHRVATLIDELVERCGPDRPVALCRELTKVHEEVWRGDLAGAMAWLADRPPRGEFVVVLGGGAAPPAPSDDDLLAARAALEGQGMSRRDAAAEVAARFGAARNHVYRLREPGPDR